MGAEFTILRREPRESYYLGKPRLGYPDGVEVPPMPGILKHAMRRGIKALREWSEASTRWSRPGWAAMFEIMTDDGDYRTFRLAERPVDELAALVHMALSVDTLEQARAIAIDLKRWAGDDDLILCCDGEIEPLEARGFTGDHEDYAETGAAWKVRA